MALDQTANFIRGETDASTDASQTSISVVDASIFPDPTSGEYNLVFWDADTYPRPDQDPSVEIARVTARDTGTNDLTVTRGQETTTGSSHPSGSALHLTNTSKTFEDIQTKTSGLSDDGESLSIESIGSERHYAGSFDGATADDRLSNAIATASESDVIYLENEVYSEDVDTSTPYIFKGSGHARTGTELDTGVTWTLPSRTKITGIAGGGDIVIDAVCTVSECWFLDVTVTGDRSLVTNGGELSVTFNSGTTLGLADSLVASTTSDNGTNSVGDVS